MTQPPEQFCGKQRTYVLVAYGISCAFTLGVSQPRSGSPNSNPQEKHT